MRGPPRTEKGTCRESELEFLSCPLGAVDRTQLGIWTWSVFWAPLLFGTKAERSTVRGRQREQLWSRELGLPQARPGAGAAREKPGAALMLGREKQFESPGSSPVLEALDYRLGCWPFNLYGTRSHSEVHNVEDG